MVRSKLIVTVWIHFHIAYLAVVLVFVGRMRDPFERFSLSPLLAVSGDGCAEVLGRLAAAGGGASVDGAGN